MGNIGDVLLAIQAASAGGRAIGGAIRESKREDSVDNMVQQATSSLSSMGLPEASAVAELLGEDRQAADQFVTMRYGSWDKMFSHLHNEREQQNAANAIREAGGESNVPDYVRRRREYAAGTAEAGQTASAGQMSALFPAPITPQQLGIDPNKWTGESVNAVMQSYSKMTGPDFTPLELRESEAGVPANVKLPTGWMWIPDQTPHAQPIPGTNAEQNFLLNKIMKKIRAEGLSISDYFKKYPGEKAFFDASLKRLAKDDPFFASLMASIQQGSGGGPPAPAPGTPPPAGAPTGRSDL